MKKWIPIVLCVSFMTLTAIRRPKLDRGRSSPSSLRPAGRSSGTSATADMPSGRKTISSSSTTRRQRDGQQPKSRPAKPALDNGWIDPAEIKDLKVRVFVSHSHEDHLRSGHPHLEEDDPRHRLSISAGRRPMIPRCISSSARGPELKSGGLEIATINSHHSGVPEVAWLIKVDGLVIYHNGDCQPDDSARRARLSEDENGRDRPGLRLPDLRGRREVRTAEPGSLQEIPRPGRLPHACPGGRAPCISIFRRTSRSQFPGLARPRPDEDGTEVHLRRRTSREMIKGEFPMKKTAAPVVLALGILLATILRVAAVRRDLRPAAQRRCPRGQGL